MEALRRSTQPSVRSEENPLGVARVLAPPGVLPQAADRLDPSLPLYADETLLEVERLNIDSASFRQLRESCGGDPGAISNRIFEITRERGKMQNPVTGSGGMLMGRVLELGPKAPRRFEPGDLIASLVSLTLTPLYLEKILQVNMETAQVAVEGHAVLFASAPAVKLPEDISQNTALAALDVCGAPAWLRRVLRPEDRLLILGAGRSGVLAGFAVAEQVPPPSLWMADVDAGALERVSGLGVFQNVIRADAQDPLAFAAALRNAAAPAFDLVVNTSNAPETEMATILATRPGGRILFFNMATQFSRAVLSAEGIGRDVTLLMGNGYAEGHAEYALALLRRHQALREYFSGKRGA